MKKLTALIVIALSVVAVSVFAQTAQHPPRAFASDYQTVPVVANVPGIGGTFQTYMSIYNPTAAPFNVTATFYDASGTPHTATIALGAGELRTYPNFLDGVFGLTGGGAVTLQAPESTGGQHNNRFIVNSEVRIGGTHYSTWVPVLEFAGTNSRSFAPGISNDASTRTNVGCFNESGNPNSIAVTVLDGTGNPVSTTGLVLAPNAWGQTNVTGSVTNGTVQFDPSDNAVCYAVVVDNTTNDGRVIASSEYQP